MDIFLYTDKSKELKSLIKMLEKKGKLFVTSDVVEVVNYLRSNQVIYCFIDATASGGEPMAKMLKDDLPDSFLALITNRSDRELVEKFRADTTIATNPSQADLDSVFPMTSPPGGAVAEDQTTDSMAQVIDIRSIGPAAPVFKEDTASRGPVAAPAIEEGAPLPDEEPAPKLKAIRGKRPSWSLKDSRAYTHLKEWQARRAEARARLEEEAQEPVPEPEPKLRNLRPAYVVIGLIALLVVGAMSFKYVSGTGKDVKKRVTKTTPAKSSPAPSSTAPVQTSPPAAATTPADPGAAAPAADPGYTPAPAPAPAPPPENHAPSVSISGPSTLRAGETGYYTASGSDPDGDSVTLSWTSKPWSSGNPGFYSISVTVTDSRGASSSASFSIQVI